MRGVNWLGDAILTTPALLRLRERFPNAGITLLTHEKLAGLWRHHPAMDDVMVFSNRDSLWSVVSRLRERQFNVGLALPNSHRAALELWLARIPRRVGYAAPLRSWLLTDRVQPRADFVRMRKRSASEVRGLVQSPGPAPRRTLPPAAHHIHHYLHLAASLGTDPGPLRPRVEVPDDEVQAVKQKFSLSGDARYFGLNPGAEYGPAKRWPKERFLEVGTEVQRRTGCRWLIFGGRSDAPLTSEIASALRERFPSAPPLDLAGKTTLRDLCALLKHCRLLLTNDSGPMHVAAALGTPVVAIFGSTSPGLTAPGLPGHSRCFVLQAEVACSPCFLRECPIDFRCMKQIEVVQTVEAVLNTGEWS